MNLENRLITERIESLRTDLRVVEIEVNSRCTRRCDYCPVSLNPTPPVPKFMSDVIFSSVVSQLARIDYAGRVSYHFYNEPLSRRDLERLVTQVRVEVPAAKQVLFTNGELLTEARYASLREAGIDFIVVTAHDGMAHPERSAQIVQFPPELELSNRGGILQHLPAATKANQSTPCFAPHEMIIVTVTGDVVLCYEDAGRKYVMGNIGEQNIEDIWFSPRFSAWRGSLAKGHRTAAADICKMCTNTAHSAPGRSERSEPFWAKLGFAH